MKTEVLTYSSIGGRERNEDCALAKCAHGCTVAVVCDGLGGYSRGDEASRMAARCILDSLIRGDYSKEVLASAIREANARLYEQQDEVRMRTTVAVAWVKDDAALVATVGDTRVYLIRDSRIVYQSIDHSLAQLDVAAGDISSDEIRGNTRRNRLLRALGADDVVKPDIASLALQPDDVLLLCSDGCWELVEEAELVDSLQRRDFESWFAWIEETVVARAGAHADNSTATALRVIACEPDEEVGA